jgi:hypothetical protein
MRWLVGYLGAVKIISKQLIAEVDKQIANPQIFGLIPQSQIRKFSKVCQSANRKSAIFHDLSANFYKIMHKSVSKQS